MRLLVHRSLLASVCLWGLSATQVWAGPEVIGLYRSPNTAVTFLEAVQHLAGGVVVFIGEQHNDQKTHQFELATLQALADRGDRPVILSMEMFETDVQPVLDDYLADRIDETAFLAQSRPWPNYKTDYRPLVEFAKAHAIPVIAANAPRPMASKVAKEGLEGLQSLAWEVGRQVAVPNNLDRGAPWTRFSVIMGGHQGSALDSTWRMYEAQSLKDATMARSIGLALATLAPQGRVLHIQGRFHSDFHAGVPAFLKRLMPDQSLRVMTVVPVSGSAEAHMHGKAELADIVVFVLAAPDKAD
ncbi:MAG: ChaN family lipoprotein [Candidatus Sericytochromatia bacterium]|nr:ChaN family lipoprotein [Candidatus Sericytochromatia bacterium]